MIQLWIPTGNNVAPVRAISKTSIHPSTETLKSTNQQQMEKKKNNIPPLALNEMNQWIMETPDPQYSLGSLQLETISRKTNNTIKNSHNNISIVYQSTTSN